MGKARKKVDRAAEIAAEAKRLKAKEEAAKAVKSTGGDKGPVGGKTGPVIAPESEIVAALDGGEAVVPPPNATTVVGGGQQNEGVLLRTAPSDMDGLPKVTSTFFTTPPITPADMSLQASQAMAIRQGAMAQQAADAAQQARVERTLRRLFGQPSDRDFMMAEAGGMPSVVDGSPNGYELGGQGGESLLDFENPSPTLPPATPFDASRFPTVRTHDEPQMTLGLPAPSLNLTRGLAKNDFDYIPQADGTPGRRGQPSVNRPPSQPNGSVGDFIRGYGIKNSLIGRLAGAAYKQAGPYVAPGVSKVLAAGLDAAVIGGGAAYLVPPLVRGAYNSMFPAAAAPTMSPAPGLPQQQEPMNGDEPDYMRQLRESTIGTRNSSDIIRNLSRNRGMV